jgi:glutamyl-Q tRNA(Asp) synthetase
MTRPTFRFAPSPNGYLHLGHALSAILNADLARATGGRLLLRIEDIDATRCRPEFELAIIEDLAWLGLTFEPEIRRQSAHLAVYREALLELAGRGLVYPSFASRSEIARRVAEREAHGEGRRDPDGAPLYAGDVKEIAPADRDRRVAAGEPFAWRLDMDLAASRAGPLDWSEQGLGSGAGTGTVAAVPQAFGDIVLGRSQTPVSYHLAVVIDDALQGVTNVVRGADLFWSTSVHRLLQQLLGHPTPLYHHHRLIRDASGRKLAKSTRSTALRELRRHGLTPADIRRLIVVDQ